MSAAYEYEVGFLIVDYFVPREVLKSQRTNLGMNIWSSLFLSPIQLNLLGCFTVDNDAKLVMSRSQELPGYLILLIEIHLEPVVFCLVRWIATAYCILKIGSLFL